MKKKLLPLLLAVGMMITLVGCGGSAPAAQVAATTLPVYTFTSRLCEGTELSVTRLVTESVSCLHEYTLQTGQMRALEAAQVTVISGAGLEEFLEDALSGREWIIDSSQGLALREGDHAHEHEHAHGHGHVHSEDPHIWLSPANARVMAENICKGLCARFPEYADSFESNLTGLLAELDALQDYGEEKLGSLKNRELITFHDGFSYFAESFGLTIVKAVEEESGAEASAAELIELIGLVRRHQLPAVFTERNGSDAAAKIICAETGAALYTLDMAMAGDDYFAAMYRNIDTVWEAMQ